METLYNERKQHNLSMIELYEEILGTDIWNMSASIDKYLRKFSDKTIQLKPSEFISVDLKHYICMQGNNTEIAWNEINAIEGMLLSPNHPNDYENGLKCGWDIKLPHGTRMSLKLIHVKIKFQITHINSILLE